MVLAELRGHVALRLEQLGEREVPRLNPLLRAGHADLEQAGAKAGLTGDEARTSGGATLLAVQSVNSAPSLAMRSMLGVLYPIIPWLYALTLNQPTSSPQMMRMLGFLAARCCASADPQAMNMNSMTNKDL
jgi:hypothetical protein